jgi:hypothetical protein
MDYPLKHANTWNKPYGLYLNQLIYVTVFIIEG